MRIVLAPKSTETWVQSRADPFASPSKVRISDRIEVSHVTAPPVRMYLSCFLVCPTMVPDALGRVPALVVERVLMVVGVLPLGCGLGELTAC